MVDIERQLAGIFQVSEEKVTTIRKKGGLYSLIDIAMMVAALDSNAAKHQVTSVTKNYPEVGKAITHLKFPGRGQRETPVGNIYTVVELIMLLPGRHAAKD